MSLGQDFSIAAGSSFIVRQNGLNELQKKEVVENDDDDFQHNETPSGSGQVEINISQMYLNDIQFEQYFVELTAQYTSFSRIVSLNAYQNLLFQFPSLICQFKNLVNIDLSNNQLISIPETICSLTKLKKISARNNVLEDLPKSIQLLRHLEVLNFSGNCFEQIPSIIFEIKSLRALYFGVNRIEILPALIGTLTKLEILYLGGNRINDVPASVGRLINLTSLVLADNQIETLPPTFADLKSLQSLTLHNNGLRTLPTGIARLPNLQHLSLRNNPLVTQFVNDILMVPPTLKELTARVVKIRLLPEIYRSVLPTELLNYLNSSNQCVNPKCRGVYFESCAELVKFVDFCGKYRVPLMQYLCSPHCSQNSPAYAFTDSSGSESEDESNTHYDNRNRLPMSQNYNESLLLHTSQAKMKKILLG